jgi:diacylglycerol O-acyltransferase / wax synthase
MELMSPLDSVFLTIESREHPMHVGGLQLFEPPEGAGPEFAREIRDTLVTNRDFQPTFRKHPAWTFGAVPSVAWSYDDPDDVDIDYHVRRSALPTPGRVRELLEITSRWHSGLLDRHRPLWEAHFVEGLSDGRFAVYSKFHHSLIDGVSALRLMQRTLSPDPDNTDMQAIWDLPRRRREAKKSKRPGLSDLVGAVGTYTSSTFSLARAALLEQQLTLPFAAPRTMFNVPIGGARRVAAQSWGIDRLKTIKTAAGVTFNDVILGMCSGALRYYLQDEHALPDNPLIAMVPVSMRSEEEADAGGNQVGALLCNLATHVDDPAQRLETISASMRGNKQVFAELPKLQAYALSAALIGPLGFSALPGFASAAPPPFNIVISNVPGPREPMYWGGARLDGNYPLSIALDGQALNITMVNNADNIDFGLVGCRRSVPHLQRLLGHLETSLKDLERSVGA